MSTQINYVVTYDSIITQYITPTGSVFLMTPSAPVQIPITNLEFSRNIAPADDHATITLAGIQRIQPAREVYIYRVGSDGNIYLKFRGMSTNPTYTVAGENLVTKIDIYSLWYMLQTRLFAIAGKSPPPLQPNTNPYLVYLNPMINLKFGQIWADILAFAFKESYSTGHLMPISLENLNNVNPNHLQNDKIPYFTDFDNVVVNDQLTIQYQSVSAVIDRVVTSALFNSGDSTPFLAEYRLNIGEEYVKVTQTTLTSGIGAGGTVFSVASAAGLANGDLISIGLGVETSGTEATETATILSIVGTTIHIVNPTTYAHQSGETVSTPPNLFNPQLPTLTVMLFDPVHSILGNGQNRTGIYMGDDSIKTNPDGTSFTPTYAPMCYVEFGVVNGHNPVDTIIFSEGDNIVSVDLTYDYVSMNNSWVLTGGSFFGSDVTSLPIENQRSIAEYGLKQTNQPLQNVVDAGEIQRYIGTSINFFQHPIPNIVLKPDYAYASVHPLFAGDYVLLNAPSLSGVMEDSTGQLLLGSWDTSGTKVTAAFTARIKTIDITWNPDNGEDITFTLTFPVQNVPISSWPDTETMHYGSNAGAMQFMYTTVLPSTRTVIGRMRQDTGAATHQTGEDFINDRSLPAYETVQDFASPFCSDVASLPVPINAQVISNQVSAVDGAGHQVKGDFATIYQFLAETNIQSQATGQTPQYVWMSVVQPDGMVIVESFVGLGQYANILSGISQSHYSAPSLTDSAPLISEPIGNYLILIRNASALGGCPNPLFASLPAPQITPVNYVYNNNLLGYIICPVSSTGHEFAMSYFAPVYALAPAAGRQFILSWPAVIDPTTGLPTQLYNIYRYNGADSSPITGYPDIMSAVWIATNGGAGATTFNDPVDGVVATAETEPFDNSYTTGLRGGFNVAYSSPIDPAIGTNLAQAEFYGYVICAMNEAGVETQCSQWNSPFNQPGDNTWNNTSPEPTSGLLSEPSDFALNPVTGTCQVGSTATQCNTTFNLTAGTLVGFYLEYTSGLNNGLMRVVTANGGGVNASITTLAFPNAPNPGVDTYTMIPATIRLSWPIVPHAVGYKVYRQTTNDPTTLPARYSGPPHTPYYLITPTVLTDTQFLDDGTYPEDTNHPLSNGGSPDSGDSPYPYANISASTILYDVYLDYSYLQDPSNTTSVQNAQNNNPNTAIIYDPTQRRIYATSTYVPPP